MRTSWYAQPAHPFVGDFFFFSILALSACLQGSFDAECPALWLPVLAYGLGETPRSLNLTQLQPADLFRRLLNGINLNMNEPMNSDLKKKKKKK